ncbi:glycoside hydrolase family 6 protein [Actinomadura bangladeshensis]|uniref:Glucanase n=1 Tax=Actinomadura bangladeshensis TaxID=453573 RepID=A0A6L9QC18_9ACTN|nr:glycoside hydrolase family 6 protein [Actinomadura bangladeshensis]NEA21784.1 glycoside hydrolase family 6 protein [Actinomadura bangladeshensis]
MRRRIGILAAATASIVAVLAPPAPAQAQAHGHAPGQARTHGDPLAGKARFYVEPSTNAGKQADLWAAEGRGADAAQMRALSKESQAIWFTGGTPAEVRTAVRRTMHSAAEQRAVPVLVAYNVPGRDCSQYSAGGAPDEAAYRAWIDAFAKGVGGGRAVVIVEPDGLALLSSEPWCNEGGGGTTGTPEDTARVDERFREIDYAITTLQRLPRTGVYVDSGHSDWQPLNDYDAGYGEPRAQLGMAGRLIKGGIAKADGFALNVSNYRSTDELVSYGTRLSKCLRFRQETGAASCSDTDLAGVPDDPRKLTHFVLDTSRNGQGPWTPPAGQYTDAQVWCNPPGRGLGARPSTRTGDPLVDAFLWVKRPGESDGQCTRGTAGPEDPEYGVVDPAAGAWWGDYALGLAQRAVPPLR